MKGRAWVAAVVAGGVTLGAIALIGGPGAAPRDPLPEPTAPGEVSRAAEAPGSDAPVDAGRTETAEARCRCVPLDLRDYYSMADEVALARLVSFDEFETHRVLRMVHEVAPWRTADTRGAGSLARGDTVEYRTAVSTATCGVVPQAQAVYVVFGRASATESGLHVDTCSGTRVHRSASGEGDLGGFQDVPGRFVVRQLDALGGLDVLSGLGPLPDPVDSTHAVLRGLLDLEPLTHGGTVRIFDRPDSAARVLVAIDSPGEVVAREVGYEVSAAAVFGRVDGWSRVLLADGRGGWISPEESGTWFPYEDLPVRRLAYLTAAWSGYVWPEAGAGIPARVERGPGNALEQPAEVLESRLVGGFPWFRVSVLDGSPCEGTEAPRTAAGGWVPAYGLDPDATGLRPTVWYWSRGC